MYVKETFHNLSSNSKFNLDHYDKNGFVLKIA